MTHEEAARAQLQDVERDLEAIRFRLMGVHSTLPPAPEEFFAHVDIGEKPAMTTHLRAVIETLLEDKIEPALRDLRALEVLPETCR